MAPPSVARTSTAWNSAPTACAMRRTSPKPQPTAERSSAHAAASTHATRPAIVALQRWPWAVTRPESEHVSRSQDRTNRIAPRRELLGVLRRLEAAVGPVPFDADEGARQESRELPDETLELHRFAAVHLLSHGEPVEREVLLERAGGEHERVRVEDSDRVLIEVLG